MKIYETWTLAEVFKTVQSWASDRLRLEFLTPTRLCYHNQLISQFIHLGKNTTFGLGRFRILD